MKMFKRILFVLSLTTLVWAQYPEDDFAAQEGAVETAEETVEKSPVEPFDAPAEEVAEKISEKPERQKKVRPAYEHRGFFFSAGLGFSYFSASSEKNSKDYRSGGGYSMPDGSTLYTNKSYNVEHGNDEFSGFGIPVLEFRFGKSIGNMVALYTQFSGGFFRGHGEYSMDDRDVYYSYTKEGVETLDYEYTNKDLYVKDGAFGILFSLGLGFSVYPFRNPDFVLNGLYIGFSSGMELFGGELDNGFSDMDYSSVYTRYEIGKDWWVSESWSVGIGFAYIYDTYFVAFESDTELKSGSIQFFIRLTHG